MGNAPLKRKNEITKKKCPVCDTRHPADEGIVLYVREFICPICDAEWTDLWCSDCNDHCPGCDAEIESQPDSVRSMIFEKPVG